MTWKFAIILLCVLGATAGVRAQHQIAGINWQIDYKPGRGMEWRVSGIVLARASSVQIASPDWKTAFYSSRDKSPKIEPVQDGFRIVHPLDEAQGKFVETVRKLPGEKAEITLEGIWYSPEPAIVEWALGYFNAAPLIGSTLRGEGNLRRGQIELTAPDLGQDILFAGTALTLEGRYGRLEISGDPSLTLLDGRNNPERWWSSEVSSLWLGVLSFPIPKEQMIRLRVVAQITARAVSPTPLEQIVEPTVQAVSNLWEPQVQTPRLVPTPHVVNWGTGVYTLTPQTRLLIEAEDCRPAAEAFQEEIKTRYGWDLPIKTADLRPSTSDLRPPTAIFFVGSAEWQRQFPVPDRQDSYCVKVTPEGVYVVGRFATGAYYGAQTLMQLVQAVPGGLQIPVVTISDYPNLFFRGVHMLGGTQSDFHERMIHSVLSHLKFNHLVLECEYTQWQTDREIWVKDRSMPKPVLKRIVKTARDHYLEPIPLIQSLGHCEWMFRNKQNLDLAEDPETPYAYCPRREATYDFIRSIFAEALDIFEPKHFHIGHDEVTMRGRFPHSPECKDATVAQLFLEDTKRLQDYLKQKKVERVFMWSDMLLAKGEANDTATFAVNAEQAKQTRQGLPKDLVQCDWHYTPTEPDKYISLPLLKEAGFERIIATSWYQPQNVYTFAQAARAQGIWGLLQSTWAGYNLNENTLRDALPQFAAYVLAAEYAWNTESPAPDQLPYRASEVLLDRYFREPISLEPLAGFTVDLRSAYNVTLADPDGQGWVGYGSQHDLRTAPTGLARLNGWQFQLADSTEKPSALMLAGSLIPGSLRQTPTSVRLMLNRKAATLLFLHCTGFPVAEKADVGRYVVRYSDGSEEAIPLLYGVHVRAWDDVGMTFSSRVAWEGKTAVGKPVLLRVMRWQNPHPNRTIQSIELRVTDGAASPVLIGLSGV